MATYFLAIASNIIGIFIGAYAAQFVVKRRADRLMDTLKARHPREFEIWKQGYRQACVELFSDEDS